jgi:hypothetical protein
MLYQMIKYHLLNYLIYVNYYLLYTYITEPSTVSRPCEACIGKHSRYKLYIMDDAVVDDVYLIITSWFMSSRG